VAEVVNEAFVFGRSLAARMQSELPEDYVGSKNLDAYGVLAEYVFLAGHGDYLEIGTWRGASAIVAALTKERFGLGGSVVCVDHFCGYSGQAENSDVIRGQAETTMRDYGACGIEIVQAPSRPFPESLGGRLFSFALIDGDHWGGNPRLDFLEIQGRVQKFIMFDDCDSLHADVISAVIRSAAPPWWASFGAACAILEKR
jgi:hypothetical protein